MAFASTPTALLQPSAFRLKNQISPRWGARVQSTNVAFNIQGKSFPLLTAISSSPFGRDQTDLSPIVPVVSGRSPFGRDQTGLSPVVPAVSGRGKSVIRQAFIYHSSGFRIPSTAEKPEWWWRTLSCIPYLLALKMSEAGFFIHPLIENFKCFEDIVYYIPGAVNRLPTWFPLIYFNLAIMVVVKNRDLPLFFRFNVMMGILLEIGLQVMSISSNFMPLVHFKGTLGMYYWAGLALAYVLIMMECVRCAVLGTFVKIPLLSESAFIHSLFH